LNNRQAQVPDAIQATIESEERLRLATEASGMFAWEIDLVNNTLKWGRNASQVIGCRQDQLTTDPSHAAFFAAPEERGRMMEIYEAALRAGDDFYTMEFRGTGGPDHAYWSVSGVLIRDEAGQPVRTVGATQNITRHRKVARALDLTRERLVAAEEASGALIYDWDVIENKVWRSAGLTRQFGWRADEIDETPQGWSNLRHPEDVDRFLTIDGLESGLADDRYAFEYRVRHKNGNYLWVLDAGRVERDKDGNIIRIAGATVDINSRKIAEIATSRQNILIELSFEPIFVWSLEKGIVDWNRGAELLYGFSKQDALGHAPHDLLQTKSPHSPARVLEILRNQQIWSGELEQRAKDGNVIVVESRLQAFANDGDMVILETNRDVTQRQRADRYTARLAAVTLASHDALFGITLDGFVQTWNPGAERIFGYSSDEIIGQHIRILADDSRYAEQQDLMRQAQFDKTVGPYEARRLRKDGSLVDVSVSIAPVKSANGSVLSLSVAVHDITDRKEWEARQKLMTRELVHRIKNSFAVLQGILRSTLRTAQTPQEFADAFSGRLQSLSAAQDVLTANDWRGAELGSLVHSQLSAYVDLNNGRVEITGPKLVLPAEFAAPFGLVFNELATNAMKYGALSVVTGSVIVFWRTVREMDVGVRVFLTWRERGGPLIKDPPGPRSFGSSLIERSLAGAKVESRYEPEGLVCTIEVLIPDSKYTADH
jgi:PAS domain S-box-containing protein